MSKKEAEGEDAVAEAMVENYARENNIPVEIAKQRYLPLLKAPTVRDRIKREFADAAEILGRAGDVSRDANPYIQNYVAAITGRALQSVTGGKGDEEDEDLSTFARKVERDRQKFQIIREVYRGEASEKPSPELEALKERIDGILGQVQQLTETLEGKKKAEDREEYLKMLDSKITPLQELARGLQAWKDKLEGGEANMGKIDSMLSNLAKYEDDAKTFLEKRGYNVDIIRGMTKEEVQRLLEEERGKILEHLTPEEVKSALEKRGYKIEGGPMTYEQYLEKMQEERKKWEDEKIADRQISAVENIVTRSVDRLVGELVSPLLRGWYEASVTSRAGEQPPPPTGGEEPSQTSSEKPSESSGGQE